MRNILCLLTSLGVLALPLSARAQDATPSPQPAGAQNTQARMQQLAGILGALQSVRTLCEPADGDFWRERMMEMIRIEKPSAEQTKELTLQFNAGYNDTSTRFATCTSEARSFASDTARQGEALAQAIADSIKTAPSTN